MPTNRPPSDPPRSASAPARLCLGGEDLDWIGGPALLTAIELRVAVRYQPELDHHLEIRARGALDAQMTLTEQNWAQPVGGSLELMRLCWHLATNRDTPRPGGTISITSDVPPEAGLASSATACVAALRALTPENPDWWGHYLVRTAYDVEHNHARRPVGPMDYVPAAFGGTTLVSTDTERITGIDHHVLPGGARFLVIDTHTPRDTGEVIAWKRQRLAQGERGIRNYARRMPNLVTEQARLLDAGGDLDGLGQSLNEAQALLQHQLAVSTALIDTCINRLRAHGALGAKLTGTGNGGCLFALTTDEEATTGRLAAAVSDLPVTARLVEPAVIGATAGNPAPRPRPRRPRRRRTASQTTT